MTSAEKTEGAPAGRRPALGRRLLLAVAAPAVFLCLLEGGLRLAGYGKPTEFFIPDDTPGFDRTNPSFTAPFIPPSFGIQPLNFRIRRPKPANTLRIFVLGESAAQGMPDPDFGFAEQLRARLRAQFPGRGLELFNLGITAINSHVVRRAARQAMALEPDLLVIYMGNNEVVGPYGPGCAYLSTIPPLGVIRASAWVRGTRTGQLLAGLFARLAPAGARARDWQGMETFADDAVRGDDPRLEAVYRNFAANLRDIVEAARERGTRVVLSTVVANLKDSAPFLSLPRRDLSAAEAKAWKEAYDAGVVAWDLGDGASAMGNFREAERIDPQFAETHFRLGGLAEAAGDGARARQEHLDALHWDALRFRPDRRINEIIRATAASAGPAVLLVDAAKELGADPGSAAPAAGRDILFDHVHFNWEGNARMARLLAPACARQLGGGEAPAAAPLDDARCAAALGYTPEARLRMLQTMVQLRLRPPFSSQSTFTVDQAILRREIEDENRLLGQPGARDAALEAVAKAAAADPGNAGLALRLASMEADRGDSDRALALADRAQALQPPSAELARLKARVLVRLKRFAEAEALLRGSLQLDEDYFVAGGALVDLWGATRQFDQGRRFFAQALAPRPGNPYLRLEYANLLSRAGDLEGAAREARRVWEGDPRGRPAMAALELLVRVLGREQRSAEADELTLRAAAFQAGDYFNDERLVRIYAGRNDRAGLADALGALAASGPFDAGQHFELARRLGELNRTREMLDELARAREVAGVEGDGEELRRIEAQIGQYRRRFGPGGSR
jgi:tetratricopeptide (TPR) repeat protein